MEKSADIISVVNLLWTDEEIIDLTFGGDEPPHMRLDCPSGPWPIPPVGGSKACSK